MSWMTTKMFCIINGIDERASCAQNAIAWVEKYPTLKKYRRENPNRGKYEPKYEFDDDFLRKIYGRKVREYITISQARKIYRIAERSFSGELHKLRYNGSIIWLKLDGFEIFFYKPEVDAYVRKKYGKKLSIIARVCRLIADIFTPRRIEPEISDDEYLVRIKDLLEYNFKDATQEELARAAEIFDTPLIRRAVEAWKKREKVAKKS